MRNRQDRISYLLKKYKSGLCSQDELSELAYHINTKKGKELLTKDMDESFLSSLNEATTLSEQTSRRMRQRLIQTIQPSKESKPIVYMITWLKGIAATLVLFGIGWWLVDSFDHTGSIDWQSTRTAIGEQKKLELPDGSIIFLNGGAEIQIPKKFSGLDYRVIKLNGEAFFDVESNPDKPFFVITPNFSIRVLGTSFNVDTELEKAVTVHEGKVQVMKIEENKVTQNLDNLSNAWADFAHLSEQKNTSPQTEDNIIETREAVLDFVSIGPLEKAGVKENIGISKENISKTNNWMYKDLAFYDQPLELVTQQLERYYGIDIHVAPHLSGCKVNLAANRKNLDEALNGLIRLIKDGRIISSENEKQILGSSCQ